MKKTKKFSETTSNRLARVLRTIRVGKARAVEEMLTKKLTKNQAYLEILVPYLNNTSQEAIFESNIIKEEYETMKF